MYSFERFGRRSKYLFRFSETLQASFSVQTSEKLSRYLKTELLSFVISLMSISRSADSIREKSEERICFTERLFSLFAYSKNTEVASDPIMPLIRGLSSKVISENFLRISLTRSQLRRSGIR